MCHSVVAAVFSRTERHWGTTKRKRRKNLCGDVQQVAEVNQTGLE